MVQSKKLIEQADQLAPRNGELDDDHARAEINERQEDVEQLKNETGRRLRFEKEYGGEAPRRAGKDKQGQKRKKEVQDPSSRAGPCRTSDLQQQVRVTVPSDAQPES